jgi:hypothetical protein
VKQIIFIASALVLLAACKPRQKSISDFQYFEKNRDSLNNMIVQLKEPVIQKHDQLSIFISSASLNQVVEWGAGQYLAGLACKDTW